MHISVQNALACLVAASQAVHGLEASSWGSAADCSDTDKHIFYGDPDGISQNVDVADITYSAAVLRQQGGLLTRLATDDCGDWTLYQTVTVLLLSKHLNPRVNSSVAYEDIALTIDGGGDGANVTDADKKSSLLGCGTHGGQTAVKVPANNPVYATDDYKNGHFTPNGIIVKIVKAPASIK